MTDELDKLAESISKSQIKLTKCVLDNIGIRVNMSEIPECRAYWDYVYNPNILTRWFRRIFRKEKIAELEYKEQAAFMAKVMEVEDRNYD